MIKDEVKAFMFLSVLLTALRWGPALMAAPASGLVHEAKQPDGVRFLVVGRGDEWSHWLETPQEYTVARAPDGYWRYVREYTPVNGDLRARFSGC